MFDSLLIANRGEIACRVMKTARRMGLRCIAVYSDADADARHVALADEAVRIGPPAARDSYLKIDAILAAAGSSGAQAIHPGYGFLSESAVFAEAVTAAGLVWVGPPASAIEAMGSKSAAKAIMGEAGVPLVPGYHGEAQDDQTLSAAAADIGYPLLVKASAGGGGKGMRAVERAEDLAAALDGAKREAAASFGDERVLLEKYLTQPRHVELQVFADSQGNAVHLFERDCSIQRRHQKVLEEAPAPGMTPDLRDRMGRAAVEAAKAIGYVGAGTVEFLLDGQDFYFMEMNTRLQVEHPVTEMITGQDLVEWQLRVADGAALPLSQDALRIGGHSIEVRLYAEDPARDFLPSTGDLAHLGFPDENDRFRLETGVRQGDSVSLHYDPMIAKLVVWDEDRAAAVRRLGRALAGTEVVGPRTNLRFLQALAGHPAFAAAELDTGFIARHRADLLPSPEPAGSAVLALASLAEILHRKREAEALARRSPDPHSPWNLRNGWRLNSGTHSRLTFLEEGRENTVELYFETKGYRIEIAGQSHAVRGVLEGDGRLDAEVDGARVRATVVRQGHEIALLTERGSHRLRLQDPLDLGRGADLAGGRLTAPMPGRLIKLLTEAGAQVTRGTPLLVLEAMKMEHTIGAPADGRIAELFFQEGDLVDEGVDLLDFEPAGATA